MRLIRPLPRLVILLFCSQFAFAVPAVHSAADATPDAYPAGAANPSAPLSATPGTAPSDSGSDSLGLSQALQQAVGQSPVFGRAEAEAAEMGWGRVGAASQFLPHLSLDATRFFLSDFQTLPFQGLTFPEVFPYAGLGLNASWTLFSGGSRFKSLGAAGLNSEAADLERDWALFKLKQDVRLKFYQALGAQKLAAVSDENVKTLEDHLKMVQDLLDNGRATRFDLLRVEVQLDDARTEQLSAQDRLVMARRALASAMGMEQDSRPLAGDLPPPQDAPTGALSLDDKPDVKAKLLKAEAAQDASAAAAAHWLPTVSLIGAYQWYENGYNLADHVMDPADTSAHGTDYNLGLAASWELFNGGGSLAAQMEASKRAQAALDEARQTRLQASYDRDFWRRRLAYSAAVYKAKLADVDKAAESVRLAVLGEQAGTRTATEVLDAELDSFRASAGVVSAQMDAAEALINLELALGSGDLP
jgi:outer membrane protein TolC